MKKIQIASLILATIFIACNQTAGDNDSKTTNSKNENVDSSELKTESIENEVVELSIEERAQSFFHWYELNSSDWYSKSNDVVGIKDNFFYLDTINLNKYTTWLSESSYFSKSYVQKEEDRWKSACKAEMLEWKNAGEEADGIPPCVFEADILFMSQDIIISEAVANISISVDSQSETHAVTDYGVSKLYWIKEDGKWKITDLHYQ